MSARRVIVATVTAASLAAAPPPLAAQVESDAAAPIQASSPAGRHLIWRVSKDARTVAFLVGSVHVLSAAEYPLPAVFDQVFAESSALLEEVDLGEAADVMSLLPTAAGAIFTDGQTLRTVLDEATFAKVEGKAAATGMPLALVERMKPWLVAMLLVAPELSRAGFDPAHGLDRHYYERARAAGRPIRGLETTAYQVERLNGLPMPVQVDMLRATLDDVDAQVQGVDRLVAAWRSGDVATLETLLLAEFRDAPALYERLLAERNRDWVPKIVQCERDTAPCLVVVGGAHLLGSDGLVALLAAAGFTLEQL